MTDDAKERLLSRYVEEPGPLDTPCWMWTAGTDGDGYGAIHVNNKQMKAHRLSYELLVGPIPEGMLVCHHCDRPACIQPSHLYVGDAKTNSDDMWARGRGHIGRGEEHSQAILTEEDVAWIKYWLWTGRFPQVDIAEKYGVERWCVWHIASGKNWSWVEMVDPEDMPLDPFYSYRFDPTQPLLTRRPL